MVFVEGGGAKGLGLVRKLKRNEHFKVLQAFQEAV